MKLERKCTLTVIKALPPKLLKHYIEEFEIPSPYKEILTVAYLENYKGYSILTRLEEKYNISMPFWTYYRRLNKALDIFRVSYLFYVDKSDIFK